MINEHEELKSVVREVIHSWNPYGLLPHAPSDEFHSEIDEVTDKVKNVTTVNELGHEIQQIFERSFGDSFNLDDCLRVAEQIWAKLNR